MNDGTDPIANDELIYRRVPVSAGWYNPDTKDLSQQAFAPHQKQDITGLSVSRAKYKSVEEAAAGRPGKSYYVAVLNAGDIRLAGIEIVPRPVLPDDLGHSELPQLTSAKRKDSLTLERESTLKKLTLCVEGPFLTAASSHTDI